MKRCPECRRDYYDDSLAYCLEDGVALVQGSVPVASGGTDEPATAILHDTSPLSEAATRAQVHATEPDAVLPRQTFNKRLLVVLIAMSIAIVGLGVIFGYRYLRTSTKQISSIA